MTLEELTPWLFSRTSGGIKWGLDTTVELLAGVGDPHRHFHSIHVAGTNGKGSVAALTDSALRASGSRSIGLYTSPHLVSFAERIRIDGKPASDEMIAAAAERLRRSIERTGATFFEATTAIAFLCFAEAGVELAVVEVGLGGRLDSTNVVEPIATAVTNVARDHTEFLGESLPEIASEKAGIFKPGVVALTAERDPAAVAVLRARAGEVGAPFHLLDEVTRVDGTQIGLDGTRIDFSSSEWGERRVRVPLPGEHQVRNALLAAELLARLPEGLRPEWRALEEGFAATRWPGRFQVERRRSTTWIFDVAHNPAGVASLVETLGRVEVPRPIILLTAILSDKPWREMLAPLLALADGAILTTAPSAPGPRRWDPNEAAGWAAAETGLRPRVIEDLEAALQRAETLAPHGTILVTGSVHTVGDAMALLGMAT